MALTHPSFANEQRQVADNQRLEFLGDAVLGFCTSELLFLRFPDADEGTLTRLRARLVNAEALAELGTRPRRRRSASSWAAVPRQAGLRASTNVLADAVEALVAAAYLDGGLEMAQTACARIVREQAGRARRGRQPGPKE